MKKFLIWMAVLATAWVAPVTSVDAQDDFKRPVKLVLIRFNEAADADSGELAIKAGLIKAGMQEGADYVMKVTSAQNDLPTLVNIVDAAVADNVDILVPLQSVTLQPTVQRAKDKPVVFHLVSDPILLNVAKSDDKHLPTVTGAYIKTQPAEFEMLLGDIKSLIYGAKNIACLYVPGEIISRSQKALLEKTAKKMGMNLKAVPVDTISDLSNAIQAMLSPKPDAIVMIEGSIPNGAFGAVTAAAQRAKVPIFGFTSYQVNNGAVLCIVPDVGKGGEAVGEMIKKIVSGTSPKDIPLYRMPSGLKLINSGAARRIGMEMDSGKIPGSIDVSSAGIGLE